MSMINILVKRNLVAGSVGLMLGQYTLGGYLTGRSRLLHGSVYVRSEM